MPLNWLGQLNPTMQQQIALQRALLALQREDEQIRLKTMPQTEQPALTRGLQGGAQSSAGPIFDNAKAKEIYESHSFTGTPSKGHFRPGAGSLEEALKAAQPSPGYEDPQAKAWARREEMLEERVVSAKEAYDRIITLDPAGQKVALGKVYQYKREIYNAMEREGYLTPAGELVQPKQEATSVQYVTTDNGEMIALTTYPDGRIETEHTGVYPAVEAEEAGGPTISEAIGLEKLGMEQVEFAERHQKEILDVLGPMPKIGIDTMTVDGKEVLVDQTHVNAWLEGYALLNAVLSAQAGEAPPEGEATMSEAQAEFEASSGEVKMAIQQKLGVEQTGEWDEPTEFAFSTYGDILLGEEPTEEGKPRFERQKKFWGDWMKKWGKVIKGTKSAAEVLKGYVIK